VSAAVEFFTPGRPAPQGSKRHVGGGVLVESSKAVKPWRVDVQWAARAACRAPLDGPVALRLEFVMPRPKSTPKRSTPPAIRRPDVDKLARAVLDALTGVVVGDDSQIVDLHATKRLAEIGETPGVHVVASVPEAPLSATHSPAHTKEVPVPTPAMPSPAETHTAPEDQ